MSRVPPSRRNSMPQRWILALLPVFAGASLFGGAMMATGGLSPAEDEPLMCSVTRGDFLDEVAVEGEVESAGNVEVRCEVHSDTSYWIRILEVVPEGTRVQPGDFLVRLDSSNLEAERDRQKVVCEQAAAALIQARARQESAKIAAQSYLAGEYAVAHENARLHLLVAEDRERRAREFLESSRRLADQGYITELQLRADEYAWKAARTELGMARIKLAALENFTRPTRLAQLRAALVTANAHLTAAQLHHKLSLERLKDIEKQIAKCVVRAHVSGQVVLAHLFHWGHAHMVEPGELTMEKRVLVRLPDFRHMQVAAKIAEDKIARVEPGLPATIRLEAFPNVLLRGRVVRINAFPEAEDWLGSAVKRYKTIVQIEQPPPGTRPGMTAELTIYSQRLKNRLQVPCPAVLRHGDRNYCICYEHGHWQAREVLLGPNNGTRYVVREGLKEGEQIVLSAAAHRDKVGLPGPSVD